MGKNVHAALNTFLESLSTVYVTNLIVDNCFAVVWADESVDSLKKKIKTCRKSH